MALDRKDVRLTALRRFATSITLLNLIGHSLLGFEQSWAQPLVALLTAYVVELLLEWTESRAADRRPAYGATLKSLVDFLLPAHITGLAVAMLLYANDRLWPIAFATAVSLASKRVLRMSVGGQTRHFLNPSNTGIALTLLLFPWIGIAPPYHFTETLQGWQNWALPVIIVVSGTALNHRLTRKGPLILSWLAAFVAQAAVRSQLFDTPIEAALAPATGVAFLLFSYYMLSDPATTPFALPGQIAFGASVAVVYGVLVAAHVVFGLFFALGIVCAARGLGCWAAAAFAARDVPFINPNAQLNKAG